MAEHASRAPQDSLLQPGRTSFSASKSSLAPVVGEISQSASSSKTELNIDNDPLSGTLSDIPTEPELEKVDLLNKDERELSEDELRRLFDNEEIQRFLGLFADYVSEVTLPNSLLDKGSRSSDNLFQEEEFETQSPESSRPGTCGDHWLSIDSSKVPTPSRIPPSASNVQHISERIAFKYVLPVLPPARPRPQRFTVGRLRITIQRLYFVAHPAYRKFFSRLTHLATWKDRNESALYCALFWTLWYRNLLMPAAFFRILYSLLRRRFLPYPTLKELRERRCEAARTEELGAQIQLRLGTTSSSGLLEAWRLFRIFSRPNKTKAKHKQTKIKEKGKIKGEDKKEKAKGKEKEKQNKDDSLEEETDMLTAESVVSLTEIVRSPDPVDDPTVLDDPNESQEEKDFKRELLNSLNDLADVHERVKNIFLWRLPSTSRTYITLLAFLTVLTIYLPTKYIVKVAIFIVGFLYWHIIPIIAALPPPNRARLPPLFDNAPTDAEFAMDLISKRIARGEDIRPPVRKQPRKSKKTRDSKSNKSTTSLIGDEQVAETSGVGDADERSALSEGSSENSKSPSGRPGEVDWRKWGERANVMKAWATQGRKNEENGDDKRGEDLNGETHTFLAHHSASPGTLSISRTALLFTPVTSTRPKIRIALDDMRGVKKIGLNAIPGLNVKWQRSPGSGSYNETEADAMRESEIVEEKFRWVGGRDEVFARLVGWGGRKWLKV